MDGWMEGEEKETSQTSSQSFSHACVKIFERTCGKLRLRSSRESLKDLPPSTATVQRGVGVCVYIYMLNLSLHRHCV